MKLKGHFLILVFISMCNIYSYTQDSNIALHKPVLVSSEAKGQPASNIVDGTTPRLSKWEAANGKAPHFVEIDLKKYYNISAAAINLINNQVVIWNDKVKKHTQLGIRDCLPGMVT